MSTIKKFKVGQMWSTDFDYDGMLQCGLKTKATDKLNKLEKLFDSMEDVNYHSASAPLWSALVKLRNGNTDIENEIKQFHLKCQEELDINNEI